ncbi:phage tail assembly chaperone [Methylobacterium brachythecii]|uniref:phage tail assembly chaperone n=1 Tax=Methylobacterium brachythecii TaxID=1176177 RepID=UPI00161DEA6A|nr:phage tail assembly chaperone [Methylobacterium brachythecii]
MTSEAAAFAFPWDDALALGLHALRWTPTTFWSATPRELAAAAGLKASPAAGRADLDRLLAAFPDP